MRAGTLFALFAIVALLLQTTVLPRVAIDRGTPDLLLILCVYLGLHQHTVGGAVGAFFLGYLQDVFSGPVAGLNMASSASMPPASTQDVFAGPVVGLNAFGMCLVFATVYLTSRRLWVDNAISKVVVVFLASVLKTLAVFVLLSLFGLSNSVPRYLFVEAVLAAILSPAIFAVLSHAEDLSAEEEE